MPILSFSVFRGMHICLVPWSSQVSDAIWRCWLQTFWKVFAFSPVSVKKIKSVALSVIILHWCKVWFQRNLQIERHKMFLGVFIFLLFKNTLLFCTHYLFQRLREYTMPPKSKGLLCQLVFWFLHSILLPRDLHWSTNFRQLW